MGVMGVKSYFNVIVVPSVSNRNTSSAYRQRYGAQRSGRPRATQHSVRQEKRPVHSLWQNAKSAAEPVAGLTYMIFPRFALLMRRLCSKAMRMQVLNQNSPVFSFYIRP